MLGLALVCFLLHSPRGLETFISATITQHECM
ncbi:uncharacterized protein FFB20_11519 [Fusarium fujikuroi]|nr:uncharacterized protein FFE2_03507 [Fusarium fujikuroi]SCN78371.1 uncharacterized protein FFM5_01845 [Fusarium fujikuroi]SCN94680.1 uncharacterized protein FFC1_07086 [Fusarium fujikuroi]SCO02048.1 uncharacterized protein FFB20_11519 [Fusarium fujikuroi]SCO33820.1 uncharacterized protein FFMR_03244 [Fusarium fujikuroi]